MSLLLKCFRWVRSEIPDVIEMLIANHSLKRRLENWQTASDFSDIRALNIDQLPEYLETEWTRAKELDEKLNKLTAALSVAVTVGGIFSKTIFDGLAATPQKIAIEFLLFLSMALFLLGAIIGFSGLHPKPRYAYGAGYLRIIAEGGDRARNEMVHAASVYQIMNNIRSNEASIAIKCIRNGVILFTLAVGVSFISPVKGIDTPVYPTYIVNITRLAPTEWRSSLPFFPMGHETAPIDEIEPENQGSSLLCDTPFGCGEKRSYPQLQ